MDERAQNIIKAAEEYLLQNSEAELGNRPKYPTIILLCGETTAENYGVIKKNLDINWRRFAAHIPYVYIAEDSGGLTAKNLRSGKTGNVEDICGDAINQMLSLAETLFPDRSRLKVEIFISTVDKWDAYSECIMDIGKNLGMSTLRTLYVMAQQENMGRKKETKNFLEKMDVDVRARRHGECSVFILSNYLSANRYLDASKIHENYRLAADIILLGGNVSLRSAEGTGENQFLSMIYAGSYLKTASYAIQAKPIYEIAVNSLTYMLRTLFDLQRGIIRPVDTIQKELSISPRGIDALEKLYKEIIVNFPKPEIMSGFAMRDGKTATSLRTFSQQTYGASDLIFDRYFLKDGVYAWMSEWKQSKAEEIIDSWRKKLSFSEVSTYFADTDFKKRLQDIQIMQQTNVKGVLEQLYFRFVEEAKKSFYKEMQDALCKGMQCVAESSIEFEREYNKLLDEVEELAYSDPELNESIKKYYDEPIRAFLQEHQEEMAKTVLNIENSGNEFEEQILYWFKEMVEKVEIFQMSFEKELMTRMNEKSPDQQQLFLENTLESDLSACRRVHLLREPMQLETFYMINTDAEYAKRLHLATGDKIFDLNRTDCVEKIAIYSLEKLEDIDFMVGE